jgi:hypothetical protein
VKERYEGRFMKEGGGIILRGLLFFFEVSLGLQRGELSSVVGLDQYRHQFAGGFGHGGQDIHMISWS